MLQYNVHLGPAHVQALWAGLPERTSELQALHQSWTLLLQVLPCLLTACCGGCGAHLWQVPVEDGGIGLDAVGQHGVNHTAAERRDTAVHSR